MMDEDLILISQLNDFIFCPASIYFHNLYGNQDTLSYQKSEQINGKKAHERIDTGLYSSKKNVISGIGVYSEKYGIVGKIDIYDGDAKCLIERKRTIKKIYDGYIYQLYAQYLSMREMGYDVKELALYSMTDNKKYNIPLPEDNSHMFNNFLEVIKDFRNFSLEGFVQKNPEKCMNCIYEAACDRGMEC